MKKKRGRPEKPFEPIKASFDDVLKAIAHSKYKDKKTLKTKKKK